MERNGQFSKSAVLPLVARPVFLALMLSMLTACGGGGGGGGGDTNRVTPPTGTTTSISVKASSNKRYLVDPNNNPFLMVGDSPHAMFVNPNSAELETYLSNRQAKGFNVLWVEALCSDYILNCRNDLSTYDGIKPFTSGLNESTYDVSTPNETYWARVDSYVTAAANHGIIILFDTWETGVLMPLAELNGNTKMFNFGVFLGNRYKNRPNIIWITGNDFQTWNISSTDNELMRQLMAGIASVDTNHLQTTELNYSASGSLDNSLLAPYTTLSGVYDYQCSYNGSFAQYNKASFVPVFYEEGFYEFNVPNNTTSVDLRTQAWWAALSGANAGQMYGNERTAYFAGNWQANLDTLGAAQFIYLKSVLTSIQWYNLVPDQNHTIVTAGYGNFDSSSNCQLHTNNYVTTAYLANGTASVSYTPSAASLTVDMSKFSGAVTAKWFDPSAGTSTTITGSPFPNTGTHIFSTPGTNHDGDADWVLLLQTGS